MNDCRIFRINLRNTFIQYHIINNNISRKRNHCYKIKYEVNYNSCNPISLNLATSRFLIDYVHTWYFNVDSEYVFHNVSSSSENVDVIRIKHDCMMYRGWYLNH